jgi:hypothetical protein
VCVPSGSPGLFFTQARLCEGRFRKLCLLPACSSVPVQGRPGSWPQGLPQGSQERWRLHTPRYALQTASSISSWRSAFLASRTRSSARRRATSTPQTVYATMADPELRTQAVRMALTAPIAAPESIFRHRSRRPCRQYSLQNQRSLGGTSSATAAGVTLPHGTMRRSSSRAATRRRSHPPTAWHQGGWAASRCRSRPVPSLQQAFELRSCHRLASCPPSQGACASPSLWQGRGTSRWIVASLYFDSEWIAPQRC